MSANLKIFSNFYLEHYVVDLLRVMLQSGRCCARKNSSTSLSSLDDYTSNLVKEKSLKWRRSVRKTNSVNKPVKIISIKPMQFVTDNALKTCLDIRNLTTAHIDNLITNTLDNKNVVDLEFITEECLRHDKIPSHDIFLELISYYSRQGQKEKVQKLQALLQKVEPSAYCLEAELRHFVAEYLWIQGNVEEAMKIFLDVYSKYPDLQPTIQEMAMRMVYKLVSKGSEANLVMMTNFAKLFISKFNQFEIMCLIWELTFLSEWYSDQLWATNFIKENLNFQNILKHRFLPIAIRCLHNHDVNSVQRILELMLAINMKQQYIKLLHILFDYKCWLKDLRGCTEIMNAAVSQGIPMRTSHQVKFVQLLLGQDHPRINPPVTKIPVPKYRLKF